MVSLKKTLLIAAGCLSLALGALGIILPILPTVPFFLLTALCFAKGSERFDTWFKNTSLYHKYLEDYVKRGGMTLKQKFGILLFFTVLIAVPFVLVHNWIMRIGLLILVIIKYSFFLFKIKTLASK